MSAKNFDAVSLSFTLLCSCGWRHDATTRPSATKWKAWHREQYRQTGSRLSETGHDVTVTKAGAN